MNTINRRGVGAARDLTSVDAALQCIEQKQYEQAFKLLENFENANDVTALYALGELYRKGRGTEKDYLKAGACFYRAQLSGSKKAKRQCELCWRQYICDGVAQKTPEQLYQCAVDYYRLIYGKDDTESTQVQELFYYTLYLCHSDLFFKKRRRIYAIKILQILARRFGALDDGHCRYILGTYYSEGVNVPPNQAAGLYWSDKAAQMHKNGAKEYRDEILDLFVSELTRSECKLMFQVLIDACRTGNEMIPKDPEQVEHWTEIANEVLARIDHRNEVAMRDLAERKLL